MSSEPNGLLANSSLSAANSLAQLARSAWWGRSSGSILCSLSATSPCQITSCSHEALPRIWIKRAALNTKTLAQSKVGFEYPENETLRKIRVLVSSKSGSWYLIVGWYLYPAKIYEWDTRKVLEDASEYQMHTRVQEPTLAWTSGSMSKVMGKLVESKNSTKDMDAAPELLLANRSRTKRATFGHRVVSIFS